MLCFVPGPGTRGAGLGRRLGGGRRCLGGLCALGAGLSRGLGRGWRRLG